MTAEPTPDEAPRRDRRLVRLWLSAAPASFSWAMSQLAVGWLVFDVTGSPVAVGLAFIARLLPLAITGLPLGAASDRVGRVRVLQLANGLGLAGTVFLALAGSVDAAAVALAIVSSALYGVSDSARLVATPHLAHDAAGSRAGTRAIAMTMFVAGVGQVGGAVLGGLILGAYGLVGAAATVAAGYIVAALPLIGLPDPGQRSDHEVRWAEHIRRGIALARHHELVRELFVIAIVTEVLAFAGTALDPVFAAEVFGVGAAGLGAIVAARACGRLVGSLLVGVARGRRPFGRLLPSAVLLFGIALVGLALSPVLGVGVAFVFAAGIAGALVDSLQQAALAAAAPPEERGRAEGLWVLALGLGPVGVAEITVLAAILGTRAAQLTNGLVVAGFGVMLLLGLYGRRLGTLDPVPVEVTPVSPVI